MPELIEISGLAQEEGQQVDYSQGLPTPVSGLGH